MLGTGETGARGRQLHTLQQFVKELIRGVGIGIVTHEDTRSWMIEYGVALIGVTIVEDNAEEVRMILELRCQVKAQLSAEEQLIIVNGQWIAAWDARNRFIQPISRHSNGIQAWQNMRELLRLCRGIVTIQVQARLRLPIRIKIGGLLVD